MIIILDRPILPSTLSLTKSICLLFSTINYVGWNPPFAINCNNQKKFQTKDQSIHRLQEGISFGDGKDYTVKEYQNMSTEWSKAWKKKHYSVPDKPSDQTYVQPNISEPTVSVMSDLHQSAVTPVLPPPSVSAEQVCSQAKKEGEESIAPQPKMTPETLERDYWDIVETGHQDIDVDYGNDVDTSGK